MNVASILITIGRNITYLRTSCGYFEKDLLFVRTSRGNSAFDQSNYNKQEVSQIKKQVDLSRLCIVMDKDANYLRRIIEGPAFYKDVQLEQQQACVETLLPKVRDHRL
ncbi:anti-repressor like protein [Paenibacillus phage vB_PlaS-3/A]|uniref:Rha-like anti-repressor n=2 Tax=Fernvirus TaxID=2843380 RepID=A0A0K2CYH4_9CAUD|nr:anti-repressor [Paenibacillus phage Xenia]UYL93455.1 anti-repressor like protein [Paenibacillus phage vB_PlaS-1/A]UYL93527.1 anti-repressor like protein [Paenibacillus phage vB_PlaS-2/A]UYL93598.1 anti-repressor like protein [Paenibacillus phage vB_PlaS-3/A]UYL93669.1 anti-repressor like protein [Paenibacillus phage vB_PlaS-5/A]ALA12523.1 Rha-like anti-repressor [Paenibacillus phage Xenia]